MEKCAFVFDVQLKVFLYLLCEKACIPFRYGVLDIEITKTPLLCFVQILGST